MHDRPSPTNPEADSPLPSLDCRFARVIIHLSYRALRAGQDMSTEEQCQKVTNELRKVMSRFSIFVPDIPSSVYQDICRELDKLKARRRKDYTEISEIFSPQAWLRLSDSERAAHQVLSGPCIGCTQHNSTAYKKFTDKGDGRVQPNPSTLPKKEIPNPPPINNPPSHPPFHSPSQPPSQSRPTTAPPRRNNNFLAQLRELIRQAGIREPKMCSTSARNPTREKVPAHITAYLTEKQAKFLLALSRYPSAMQDKILDILVQNQVTQSGVNQGQAQNGNSVTRASQPIPRLSPSSIPYQPPRHRHVQTYNPPAPFRPSIPLNPHTLYPNQIPPSIYTNTYTLYPTQRAAQLHPNPDLALVRGPNGFTYYTHKTAFEPSTRRNRPRANKAAAPVVENQLPPQNSNPTAPQTFVFPVPQSVSTQISSSQPESSNKTAPTQVTASQSHSSEPRFSQPHSSQPSTTDPPNSSPPTPPPQSPQILSPPPSSSQLLSPQADDMTSSPTRLNLQDLSNIPENGVWIVKVCKALFELTVGSVINTTAIAIRENAPSRKHVTKLAQLLGLETKIVEHQEILSGFKMFRNSADFNLEFASQIAKVTIHQILEGDCPDDQLSRLCGVIADLIMQAFNLHRDTPSMTVAKIIMIQGSPLLPSPTSPNTTVSGTRRASRHSTGGSSSGESAARKRRKMHSGATKRSPKKRTGSSTTGETSENSAKFNEAVQKLSGQMPKTTPDDLDQAEKAFKLYSQVVELITAMTDSQVDITNTSAINNGNEATPTVRAEYQSSNSAALQDVTVETNSANTSEEISSAAVSFSNGEA